MSDVWLFGKFNFFFPYHTNCNFVYRRNFSIPPPPKKLIIIVYDVPLVSGRVLHESGLVAETVTAVLAHAVEMGLVFPVTAVRVMAVLVEPEPQVSFGNRFVLKDSHRVLDPGFPHFRAHVARRRRRPVEVRCRRGRRVVPGGGRFAAPVQQAVGQHGLVMVETGRWCEHQT